MGPIRAILCGVYQMGKKNDMNIFIETYIFSCLYCMTSLIISALSYFIILYLQLAAIWDQCGARLHYYCMGPILAPIYVSYGSHIDC